MGKAFGAMVFVFSVGGASMTLLSRVLGGLAEAAALALIGIGLFATSHLLGGKLAGSGATPVGQKL